jgi:hypothetical protein
MMLSELAKKSNELLEKYGDRKVLVDTEAMEYICHWVEPTDIGTVLCQADIDEDPLVMSESGFDAIIIHLDDRVKKIPKH